MEKLIGSEVEKNISTWNEPRFTGAFLHNSN